MRIKAKSIVSVAALALFVSLMAGCASTDSRESTGQYIDSSIVTAAVKAALLEDELTSVINIEVETFRDVVQLSGFVDSEAEKQQAGVVAAEVDGVVEVKNSLVVKPAS